MSGFASASLVDVGPGRSSYADGTESTGGGDVKYLLMICVDETPDGADEAADVEPWVREMDGRGVRLTGDRLRPPSDATTVRVRGGEVLVTDGPYAETKEQMGGFDIIECADLDEAIEVASKHPVARFGMIEVRPFWTG
jgi:hypothetical protein